MSGIDRARLAALHAEEEQRFVDLHPTSARLAAEAGEHLLAGVPMPWMTRWPGSSHGAWSSSAAQWCS